LVCTWEEILSTETGIIRIRERYSPQGAGDFSETPSILKGQLFLVDVWTACFNRERSLGYWDISWVKIFIEPARAKGELSVSIGYFITCASRGSLLMDWHLIMIKILSIRGLAFRTFSSGYAIKNCRST
jgi:hypothetical protein